MKQVNDGKGIKDYR